MPVSFFHRHRLPRARLLLLGLGAVLGTSLGGCASVSDTISPAFVDPARYDLYDCKQLAAERRSIVKRLAETERLMAKAETATGGAIVSEIAYRNDYVATRGQQKLMEETWQKNRCRESDMEETPPADAAPPASSSKPSRSAPGSKSGSVVR